MHCPSCGMQTVPGDHVCSSCGADLGAKKSGLPAGAIVGIVIAVLVGVLLLGAASLYAFGVLAPKKTVEAADPGYVVVTEAEARDVVTRFIELRAKKNISASRALCTARMLKGSDGDFVNDQYWNPDSFKIVKVTSDQMYLHVASMGMWPSGEEPTIFSVFREPESGKVLIDGFIDPETSPDLYQP